MFNPPTFFLGPEKWQEPYRLEQGEAHHLSRVLRIEAGRKIRLIDGQGREGMFRVRKVAKNHVLLDLEHTRTWAEPQSKIHLALAWNKGFRRSWLLEKAVELGVWRIILWQARRSQGRTREASQDNWQGKIIAAAKQSQNPWIPETTFFHHGVDELINHSRKIESKLLLWEEEKQKSLMNYYLEQKPEEKIVVVGPEGGLDNAEVEALVDAGFTCLTLGPKVLRWETAALAPLYLDMLFRSGIGLD
ncbi:16S rRNA (uracil(1498)-N(3))-methyltransferase [Desulfonatronovibrio hydrogenovorans]|uniref:16S rRNA (uracil(1498)-N(3))-methyltransferase n=1 Tax=Desulfonatronovibrio hydrogenovorans TaxID=53245 RepID=UPI0006922FAC|nr:16S rRNA (uracil(1498)-N(3))-methyltransferase [Desulfonatronovibrio hydrogenovorans]